MANGTVMASDAHWTGYASLGDSHAKIAFKVFDSGGNPTLEAFKAVHDYGNDTITIPGIKGRTVIKNEALHPYHAHIAKLAGANLALDVKQYKPEWLKLDENTDKEAAPICIVMNDTKTQAAELGTNITMEGFDMKQSLHT